MRLARKNALFKSFNHVAGSIIKEVEEVDAIHRQSISEFNLQRQERAQPIVKILSQFEEFSEYENIFTGNKNAEITTKNLNRRIQDLVADTFSEVQFAKDYQEQNNQAKKAFDSNNSEIDDDEEETPKGTQIVHLEYVKEGEIIYCNEFHDDLEYRLKELSDSRDKP